MITKQFHSQVYGADLVYEKKSRLRKTKKIIRILKDAFGPQIKKAKLLDVGCAEGIISSYLSPYFRYVVGVDVDRVAIRRASNLSFKLLKPDGSFPFGDNSFDIIVANQIYEHAENPKLLMDEIYRVLKQDGICFLGAGNRLVIRDAHYPNLPFVSWLPIWLADFYVRWTKSGEYYEPRLRTIIGIKKLMGNFIVEDFTLKVIRSPFRYYVDDLIKKNSFVFKIPGFALRILYPMIPNYLFVLRKQRSHRR